MRELIGTSVAEATGLPEVEKRALEVLHTVTYETGLERLGYAAGVITSDGEEHIETNIQNLRRQTETLERSCAFPVFCAADIFTPQLFDQLPEMQLEREEREACFMRFWRNILTAPYITDVFLTPGWRRSSGAVDEYMQARSAGKRIHHV